VERINALVRQNDTRKVWSATGNMVKRRLNINEVEPRVWVNYFRSLFDRNIAGGTIFETQLWGPPYIEELHRDFTEQEIKDCLCRTKRSKATGIDGLLAKIWKTFGAKEERLEILENLFNKIRIHEVYPEDWKMAIVCPLYKSEGRRRDPGNYREIFLLPAQSKVFSNVLAGGLRDWLTDKRMVSKFQLGFVKNKRTIDNIFVIKTTVDKYLREKRGRIYWCFVDLKKVFDSVNREALWYKRRKKGISEDLVDCIRLMYDGIQSGVKCGDDLIREAVDHRVGIRQGCSLSPYLFNAFIDDIMDEVGNGNNHAPTIAKFWIPGQLFADNLALGAFTDLGLQMGIGTIVACCSKWNLKCNLENKK
jgi:hypothetical protein